MAKNRILYLAVIAGCLVFYVAYRAWFSWFLLLWVLSLPLLSLLLSLLAVRTAKVAVTGPCRLAQGQPATAQVCAFGKLPVSAVICRIRSVNTLTGESVRLPRSLDIPTEHCGQVRLEPEKVWLCDYLGLLRLPVKMTQGCKILIEPQMLPMQVPPKLKKRPVTLWRPRPGGFSEEHDLRPYRPGDSLRLIHWKITAKTGKLIYREPIEALQDKAVLTMALSGTPELLDKKLGRLLWLSSYLAGRKFPHQVRCAVATGIQSYPIATVEDVIPMLHDLLRQQPARAETLPDAQDAFWQYAIGGDADEA